MITVATGDDLLKVFALAKQYDGKFSKHVTVDLEYATKAYTNLINQGICVVFALWKNGEVVGGLAALKFPDINCGKMTAVECFWFVNEDSRGEGLALLDSFEQWATDNDCPRRALIHLQDSYPEVLARLYKRRGYQLVEAHWVKEVTL